MLKGTSSEIKSFPYNYVNLHTTSTSRACQNVICPIVVLNRLSKRYLLLSLAGKLKNNQRRTIWEVLSSLCGKFAAAKTVTGNKCPVQT